MIQSRTGSMNTGRTNTAETLNSTKYRASLDRPEPWNYQASLLTDIQTTVGKGTDRKKQQMYRTIQSIFSEKTEAEPVDANLTPFLNQREKQRRVIPEVEKPPIQKPVPIPVTVPIPQAN